MRRFARLDWIAQLFTVGIPLSYDERFEREACSPRIFMRVVSYMMRDITARATGTLFPPPRFSFLLQFPSTPICSLPPASRFPSTAPHLPSCIKRNADLMRSTPVIASIVRLGRTCLNDVAPQVEESTRMRIEPASWPRSAIVPHSVVS